MKTTKTTALVLATASLLAATGAQATIYTVVSTSYLTNVARIGARNIPEIETFANLGGCGAACTGVIDPTNPLNWPILDATMATLPTYVNGVATGGVEANYSNILGQIDVTTGAVTAAVISMTNGRLSFGTYQTATTISDLVSGDPTVLQPQATQGPLNQALNPLKWTFNAANNTLAQQGGIAGGGGQNNQSNNTTACVIVVGAGTTGQCGQLAGGVNNSGVTGGVVANSPWNWTGIAANYIVNDGATTPWHTLTGANINVTPGGALPGVIWDLTGFVDGVGGVIKARVYADALAGTAGGSGGALTAEYTLNVQTVPVPAAAWLMGSALGLVGCLRRRKHAAASAA